MHSTRQITRHCSPRIYSLWNKAPRTVLHRRFICDMSQGVATEAIRGKSRYISPSRTSKCARYISSAFVTSKSFSDPNRPDLFYHLLEPPTPASETLPAFALSFSSERPPSNSSRTIIGWFPAEEHLQERETNVPIFCVKAASLEDFIDNPGFFDVLHSAIEEGLVEGVDDIQTANAIQTQNGWMHIHDQRNVPALNRIGDPDDIIGTVLVEDGQILPQTYQPMPAYRLITADGLMQLTPGLTKKLNEALATVAAAERATLP